MSGTAKTWQIVPNYILVGHVQEVADATTLQQCEIACLRATVDYGFDCLSAMWYPADRDQNCLLNSENRHTQSSVFMPEDQGVHMLYIDIGRNRLQQQLLNRVTRLKVSFDIVVGSVDRYVLG